MKYYRRYPGDYAADTAHLTTFQHGVYTLLLDWQYSKSQSLPSKKHGRHAIAKCQTPKQRREADEVVDEFFPDRGTGHWNPRAFKELQAAKEAIDKMSSAGRKGAHRRWGTPSVTPTEPHVKNDGVPIDPPTYLSQKTSSSEPPNTPQDTLIVPSVWDIARPRLGGPLMGKLIREHGEQQVEQAILATVRKRPAEFKSYLLGVLNESNERTDARGRQRPESAVERVERATRANN